MTLIQLKEKRDYDENMLTYYKEYMSKCLENMKRMSIMHAKKQGRGSRSHNQMIRYTGKQLKEKGVLVSIKDLGKHSLQDIVFEMQLHSGENENKAKRRKKQIKTFLINREAYSNT